MMTIADRATNDGFFGIVLPTIRIAWPSLGTAARHPARAVAKPCLQRDELEQLFRPELAGLALSGRARQAQHIAA